MSTSNTITKADLKAIFEEIGSIGSSVESASTPTASKVAEFDTNAHMNSTDMTTGSGSELESFIDGLNVSSGGVEHINVASMVDAYKCGNVVTVFFTGATTTSTSERTTFGRLPLGWIPSHLAINGNISGNTGYGCINEDGDVQAYRSSIGRVDVTVTYMATQ